MPSRTARAIWNGDLKDGKGTVALGSGTFEGAYSFSTRFGDAEGTNPEELIGAALAACFSMALAHGLALAGYEPERIGTEAEVELHTVGPGFKIKTIRLKTRARVPGIEEQAFLRQARTAKSSCPVSQALAATAIYLEAELEEPGG